MGPLVFQNSIQAVKRHSLFFTLQVVCISLYHSRRVDTDSNETNLFLTSRCISNIVMLATLVCSQWKRNFGMVLLMSKIIFYRLFIRRAGFKLIREENNL